MRDPRQQARRSPDRPTAASDWTEYRRAYDRMWEEILAQEATGELLATWIAKEELRYLLALARQHAPRSEVSSLAVLLLRLVRPR